MFEELLRKIGVALERHNIPYMVIGGQAVLLHGEPRLTRDIDITLGVDLHKLQQVLSVIKELELGILVENIESFVRQTMVIPCLDEPTGIRVDFIFSYTPYEQQAISRALKVNILNQNVCFASAEDVIIHKIFAGRARDLEDVKNIIIKNPGLDIEYIKRWLREFDIAIGADFISRFEEILKS
ncbi:MAG: nucleotidyl transferase AbiEii/AbiGii toxin family protein [Nitrospirae bacterium]|nr:nucleotidyl transferase AbiEii/AbiGii toxin family protein [Nitrospirota bacterium]